MQKTDIVGKKLSEISSFINQHNLPSYTASEISKWIYQKKAKSFDEMSNISKNIRTLFNDNFTIELKEPVEFQESKDGTKKYLYKTVNDKFIEAVYIPDKKRNTLCISSQVGCKMGCKFCMTARQGLQGQLTSGEILNQILSLPERDKVTNIVFMGMGEPFDNIKEVLNALEIITEDYGMAMNPRKINVSTIGIIPGIQQFINKTKCHLAISLHTPFDEERKKLMPVQRLFPIKEVIALLKESDFEKQRRISFEYILFEGVNDSSSHVNELAKLLNGLRCRVNIMHYHTIPGSSLVGCSNDQLDLFRDKLNKKGIIATVRSSRGEDILAACGLLSTGKV
jgi:23S rRNA (adenine2503-C2)-methyltransferase